MTGSIHVPLTVVIYLLFPFSTTYMTGEFLPMVWGVLLALDWVHWDRWLLGSGEIRVLGFGSITNYEWQ